MVTRARGRGGFTLVEVVFALVLLGMGALAAAAAGGWGARHLRAAETETRAATFAAALLDSLVAERDPAPGERSAGGIAVRWSVARGENGVLRVRLDASYGVGAERRSLSFDVIGAVSAPRLDGAR